MCIHTYHIYIYNSWIYVCMCICMQAPAGEAEELGGRHEDRGDAVAEQRAERRLQRR